MRLLLYLELRQLANVVTVTLRTPKRLIPAVLMAAYFGFLFLMQAFNHGMNHRPAPHMSIGLDMSAGIQSVVFLVMSLALIAYMVRAFSDSLLTFPLADIDYLFSSPIPRRAILTMKLLGVYAKVGLWAIFMSIFLLPQYLVAVRPSLAAVLIGWLGFVFFSAFVINMSTFINLIATYREGGKWWLSFAVRGFAYVLLLGVALSIAYTAWKSGNLIQGLILTAHHPFIVTLLIPAKWASDMMLCGLTGLAPLVLFEAVGLAIAVFVSYLLVMARHENPYEPSLSGSVRVAALRAAKRAGGAFGLNRDAWAKRSKSTDISTGLPSFGRGAMAIVWKNLNVFMRTSGKVFVVVLALAAAVLILSRVFAPGAVPAKAVESAASFIIGYAVFIASMVMMQAFRGDLKQANILKPMPIPSWQIIAAQTAVGAALVAVAAWTILILVAATYGLSSGSILLLVALCLPIMTYALLCWQAGVAIIYPKWEDQTQQFVGGMLSMFAAGMALAPPVIVGIILKALHLGVLPIAGIVIFISAGMAALGILLSGYLYSRFDPSDE